MKAQATLQTPCRFATSLENSWDSQAGCDWVSVEHEYTCAEGARAVCRGHCITSAGLGSRKQTVLQTSAGG